MPSRNRLYYVIYILILFVLTKPGFIDSMPIFTYLNLVIDAIRVVLMLSMPIVYIFKIKKVYFVNLFIVLLYLTLVISTVINSGNTRQIILEFGNILSFICFVGILYNKNSKLPLLIIHDLFLMYIVFNFLTQILFPNGWYNEKDLVLSELWFLGNKNGFIQFYLPYLYVSFLLFKNYTKYEKIVDILSYFIVVASTFIGGSATAIFCIILFMLAFLLFKHNILNINAKWYFIAVLILFYLIVILQITEYFKFLVEDILGKDITLTGRIYIWQNAIKWFKTSPIYGVGVQSSETNMEHLWRYAHCHDTYLNYLLHSGIIGFVIFIITIYCVCKNINKTDFVSKAFILTIMIAWLTDIWSRPELYFAIISLIYINSKPKYFCF